MRTAAITCVLAVSTLVGAPAGAQPDIATDHELLAAYCLGAQNADQTPATGLAGFDQMVQASREASAARLRSYLIAKGYYPSPVRSPTALQAVLLYTKRGADDQMRCSARINACTPGCMDRRPAEALLACMEKCRDLEPACPPLARCSPDKLPF